MVVLRGPSVPNNVRIMSDWKRYWCWERLKAKEKRAVENEMVRSHHWLSGHELEQTLRDSGGQGGMVCCSPCGCKESDTTEWLNNNKCQIGFSLLFKDELVWFSSVQSLSRVQLMLPHESQHARPPCPSPTPGVYSNSWPLSRWCHSTISSSVIPFFSRLQSFPISGSFQVSQLSAWDGQSIGVSASASVLPMNTQDWSPLGWTGWISLQFKGLSRVSSNTTVQKHKFFSARLSL